MSEYRKNPLEGKETIEEFLARGGVIQMIDTGVSYNSVKSFSQTAEREEYPSNPVFAFDRINSQF